MNIGIGTWNGRDNYTVPILLELWDMWRGTFEEQLRVEGGNSNARRKAQRLIQRIRKRREAIQP